MNRENQEIILAWNLGSFEPQLKEYGLAECCEILNPADFLDDHYANEYCCYPERLMYIKWMHERARFGTERLPLEEERHYLVCLAGLSLVTKQIRKWITAWKKSADELGYVGEQHKDFVDYWDKYMAHIQYWRCVFEEKQLEGQSGLIISAAKDIRTVIGFENVPKETSTEGQLRAILLEMTTSETEILAKVDTVKTFANRVDGYLRQIQKRLFNDSKSYKTMNELMDTIGDYLHQDDDRSKTIISLSAQRHEMMFSKQYEHESLHLLQQGLQKLCDLCSSIKELTDKFNSAIADILPGMPGSKEEKWKKEQLEKYTYDPFEGIKRCVALIVFEGRQYVAFSGFLDCTHDVLKEWLGIKGYIGDYFEMVITKCYNAELVCIDENVARKMRRFILKANLRPNKLETLYECAKRTYALNIPSKDLEKLQKEIKNGYSCCERKFIAHLENPDKTKSIEAILFVAKEPCLSCCLALQNWRENNRNMKLTIEYPEQHSIH